MKFLDEPIAKTETLCVLHTKPRCEKKLARTLELDGIDCYLPMRRTAHRYQGRKWEFQVPLFSGYLFAVVETAGLAAMQRNDYVANLLEVVAPGEMIQQLRQIRDALDVNDLVEVVTYLEEGKEVTIRNGPFKGLTGTVQHLAGQTQVVLSVDMIQQGILVTLDQAEVGPA